MAYRITKEYVWVGAIPDRIDALAEKLRGLAEAGLDLELIVARRGGAGHGLMFISPLRTLDEIKAAEKVGLSRSDSLRTVRIEGPNVTGLGARVATALSDAGVSMREYCAAAVGDNCVTNIAFDSDQDSKRAKEILEQLLSS